MSAIRKIISFFYTERCPFCGAPIEAEEIACDKCLRMLAEKQHPIIRGAKGYRCISSFVYDGKVRRMLIRVKFHERTQHIPQIAAILAKDIRACYSEEHFDLITTVPMHQKDLRIRGYDQCEKLSKELSKLLDIPYLPTLKKIKRTKKQHKLTYRERSKNLSGAFALIDKDVVKDKRILIIDDIVTSGYTLGNCCKVLSKAKPALICCATVANANTQVDDSAVI